jgi:hypothetical protein
VRHFLFAVAPDDLVVELCQESWHDPGEGPVDLPLVLGQIRPRGHVEAVSGL